MHSPLLRKLAMKSHPARRLAGDRRPALPPAPLTPAEVAALREAALKDDYAWDITEGLTTEVGPRLAGTEAEARARAWAVAKLKAMGFANVRVETFDMPVWVRGRGARRNPVALPAAAGRHRAGQQRRDPAAGDRRRGGRASTASTR